MRVLIVGGGLGGMMLAACMEQRGLDYRLIEQSPEAGEQGFSLGIWPNSRAMFERLGLREEFNQLGTQIHTYDICDSSGRLLKAFSFDPFYARYGMAYTQVNRQQLRALLLSKTDRRRISFNTKLVELTQSSERVEVKLTDGPEERFDLVVGADGVHSLVRELTFGQSLQHFTGWRAWYVWIDRRFLKNKGMVEFLGPGRCLGLFDDGEKSLAIFFVALSPETRDDPIQRISLLKKLFANELACLPGALDSVQDKDLMSTDLASVRMKRWVNGRVVLLGDAAHAFEPHTGLGASMAMEDAFVLANKLAVVSSTHRLSEALTQYERLRQKRVAIAQRLNWQIRTFAFIRTKAMRRIASLLIPRVPQCWFTRSYFRLFDTAEWLHPEAVTFPDIGSQFVAK